MTRKYSLHEILTEKEKEEMLKKYHAKVHQLPRIGASDPAVIAIGGRLGDVIRILRDSPTAEKHVFYRYVVYETGEPTPAFLNGYLPKREEEYQFTDYVRVLGRHVSSNSKASFS